TKIPRFTFEKFPGAEPYLTTSMKSVGEAMAMGRCFAESLQKGLRSMETGLTGLNEVEVPGLDPDAPFSANRDAIRALISRPTPDRILALAEAIRQGMEIAEVAAISKYDPWFLEQLKAIVDAEAEVKKNGLPKD